jgi:hypothetical protein
VQPHVCAQRVLAQMEPALTPACPASDRLYDSWMRHAPRDRGLDFIILAMGSKAGKDDVVVNELLVRTGSQLACGTHLLLTLCHAVQMRDLTASARTTLQAFPNHTPSAKVLGQCIRTFYLANNLCKDSGTCEKSAMCVHCLPCCLCSAR